MNNLTFGRYVPGNTPLHRLDPRVKIICMLLLMTSVFINAHYINYIVICSLLLVCLLISRLGVGYVLKAMKPIVMMSLILGVINILVVQTGDVLITLGTFSVYSDALKQTAYIIIRLVLMICITTVLTATTKPLELTLGIEDLLSPLSKIGFPAHEIAMMISIALRFIPTLIEETEKIMKAQASRGVDLQEGRLSEKVSAILSLIVPLFVSAFQTAEDLANAMEARGYVPDAKRTRYKQLHIRFPDIFCLLLCAAILSVMIWISVRWK